MRASRLLGLLVVAFALFASVPARAHPMGNFSISHYTALRVEPDGVRIRYVLDLAEIPTFQVLQAEGFPAEPGHPDVQAYLARTAATLADGLVVELDGRRLPLRIEGTEILFPPGTGELPTLKVGAIYRASLPNGDPTMTATLTYRDGNYPERAGWKEVVATAGAGMTLVASTVPERDQSRELTDYPMDPALSPPQVLEGQLVFARSALPTVIARPAPPSGSRPADRRPPALETRRTTSSKEPVRTDPLRTDEGTPSPPEIVGLAPNVRAAPRDAFTTLIASQPLGSRMLLFTLAVATSLGAFHALEPGHGKTVVAAYLVGSRGTAGHALLLGLVVTVAHTAGVYLLGLVTLYASRYSVPERLYPWLGAASGMLIALLGVSLLYRRLTGAAAGQHHASPHDHADGARAPDDHEEAHARGLAHDHGTGHGHHHHVPDGPVPLRALVALGVSGGIVPCPAALVVLLSAIALGRVGLGLLLIVAFSVGLAAVLVLIGLLVVYARRLATRFNRTGVEGPLVRRWLPLTSAAVITVSGVVIALQALGR